jgi:AbrB family looped-hinge helix DNA binding protein
MSNGTVQIDGAGRLVLPKPIRKRFNLAPGDKLRFSADEKGIHLEPLQANGELVRKGTMVVFRGEFAEPITPDLVERLLDEDRNRTSNAVQMKSRKK